MTCYTVDWNASASDLNWDLGPVGDPAWLREYFVGHRPGQDVEHGAGQDQDMRSLAQITGLVVRV